MKDIHNVMVFFNADNASQSVCHLTGADGAFVAYIKNRRIYESCTNLNTYDQAVIVRDLINDLIHTMEGGWEKQDNDAS